MDVRGSILRVAVKVQAAMLDNSTVGKRLEMDQCRLNPSHRILSMWLRSGKFRKAIQFARRSFAHQSLVVHLSGIL